MQRATLPEFLSFLNSQTTADFQTEAVDFYLKNHQLSQQDFLPFIYFREETYGRNLVFRTDFYELLVLTWLPQQRTPIHDHGGQRCWMLIQSGKLLFKNFKPITLDNDTLEVCGPCQLHEAGDTVYIDDGIGVHSIANATNQPAISVHLYAAPVPRCRIYDEAAKCFQWVELDYFTSPEIFTAAVRA